MSRQRRFLSGLWLTAVAAAWVAGSGCDEGPMRRLTGSLEASDRVVDFGATTLGMEVRRTVRLTQRGFASAEIDEVWLEPDDGVYRLVSVPSRVAREQSFDLEVVYLPLQAGEHPATLHFTLHDGDPLELELFGRGVDARAVARDEIDFGRPAVGAVRHRSLVLQNDEETAVPVTLRMVGPDAAEFSVAPALTIPARGTSEVRMRYEPVGRAGPRDVALEIKACPICPEERLAVRADAVESPLVIEPSPVDFGGVQVDDERRIEVAITNATDETISIESIVLGDGTDVGFVLDAPGGVVHLGELETVRVRIGFSPSRLGQADGTLEVRSNAEPTPDYSVPLVAVGGGAQIVVIPGRLEFPHTPTGGRAVMRVTVANGGSDPSSPSLRVTGATVSGDGFLLSRGLPPGTTLSAGQSVELDVAFQPTHDGSWSGVLVVTSDDPAAPRIEVPLSGLGGAEVECLLEVAPEALDFGGVAPGRAAVLGVRVINTGGDPCTVWDARVEGEGFELGRDRPFVYVGPGDSFIVPVVFRPTSSGGYEGALLLDTNRAAGSLVEVPLFGGQEDACLRAEPGWVNFQYARPDCAPPELPARWRNVCAGPITVTDLWLGEATLDDAFSLVTRPSTPRTLAAGEVLEANVRFDPSRPGYVYGALFAESPDNAHPPLVALAGEGLTDGSHDELYIQPAAAKVDVLWVVDNTASMREERASLAANIHRFITEADARGIDYHLGVTTTGIEPAPPQLGTDRCPGGVDGGEAGRLFPVDRSRARIIDRSMPDRASLLAANVEVGGCHSVEQGLEAARLALSPPLVDNADHPRTPEPMDGNLGLVREDAALAVVVVSDEDDQSPGSVADRVRGLRRLKPSSPLSFNAIVAPPAGCESAVEPGIRYLEAVQAIGGVAASICDENWSAHMAALADELFRPRRRFVLEATPDLGTLEVTVDGSPAGGWSYDPAIGAVVFDTAPAPGARVRIRYLEPCP